MNKKNLDKLSVFVSFDGGIYDPSKTIFSSTGATRPLRIKKKWLI